MPRYRELEVIGEPRTLGRQIGEALREEIREFCGMAVELVRKTVAISDANIELTIRESLRYAEEYAPHQVEELRGMAEGARVSLDAICLLQTRNQMLPDSDSGCSSLSVPTLAVGSGATVNGLAGSVGPAYVAQNWDSDPALDRFTVVLTRRPTGRPALTTITQAGLIAYIGFNDRGLGLCLNTLPAPARRLGVPHYFTVRGIYESSSLDEAVEAVRRAHRAIPASIMLTTPQGPANLEVTIDEVQVLRDGPRGCVLHANHCRHPRFERYDREFPELIESHARQTRLEQWIEARAEPLDIAAIQTLLRDHEGYPRSICRHANDHPRHGFWKTVFSVIMAPSAGRMWIARGNPCEASYEEYRQN